MTRGLKRAQIGVTEALVASYGELVFKLSHNHQIRRGDPVRLKDFGAIEAHAAELGLSDAQIAARIGLSAEQVTYIRNLMERRRFRRHRYHRLNQLGGGRRFRAERAHYSEEVPAMSAAAERLRGAMQFPPDRVVHYVQQGWWADDTLWGWVSRHARQRPGETAVEWAAGQLTWSELAARVERVAAGLYQLGVGPGDVVTVQLPNSIEFVVTYLAIGRIGAVMSTLYLPHRESEFRQLLGFARARVVVVGPDMGEFSPAATALALQAELPDLTHVVVVGDPDARRGAVSFESLAESDAALPANLEPASADPFLLLFTSGTTSAPKAVPLSYQNMLSNARLSASEHDLSVADRILSAAPFGHLYALYSLHLALYLGAVTALLPAFTPPALAESLLKLRPTAVFAAPAHMAACLGMQLLDGDRLASVRLLVMSGSNVAPDVARRTQALMPDATVSQLWGMTETQAGLYTRPGDAIDVVAASAGRPSPGTEVRIVDEAGAELPPATEGELQIRGCLLFPGYLGNPAASEQAFTPDGWFRTGDLATRDAAGNVAITGRQKDVINRGGVKYNPRDVEDLLDAHPAIGQSAIVPMPDEVLGERACCFVTLAPGESADGPSLEALCAYLDEAGISKVKWPERLVVLAEMPLTPTRKVIKGRLQLPG